MAEEKELRPLSSYLEFGLRLHREDFFQLTAGTLLVYLPFSLIVLFIHPPVEALVKNAEGMMALLPRMVISQLMLRVLQTFVLIMIILRVDGRRKSGEDIWDFSEAFARLGRVALVDVVYVFGLQVGGIVVFWIALMVVGIVFGENPLALPTAVMITLFAVIGPAVRYYFASYVSLFHETRLRDSFRGAAVVSSGGERLVVALVAIFMMVWLVVWQISQGIFGGGILGQLIVQAGVMTASIPYFIAAYLLFLDLAPPDSDESTADRGKIPGVIDPFEDKPPDLEPEEEKPGEENPSAE